MHLSSRQPQAGALCDRVTGLQTLESEAWHTMAAGTISSDYCCERFHI